MSYSHYSRKGSINVLHVPQDISEIYKYYLDSVEIYNTVSLFQVLYATVPENGLS